MGVFTKLFGKDEAFVSPIIPADGTVYAPLTGEIVPLSEVPDAMFSSGKLGCGVAIRPTIGSLTAPFDGTIMRVAAAKHCITLSSEDGMQALIHVGINTVDLEGKYFEPLVEAGDAVKVGQPIMRFSLEGIEAAGFSTITPITIVNSTQFPTVELLKSGTVQANEALFTVNK